LPCHPLQFFLLASLVLRKYFCPRLQVVEAIQKTCKHLLLFSGFCLVGLPLVRTHLTYQHFCSPGFLHCHVVESCPGLCGYGVPYPPRFLSYFCPSFAPASIVDFALPSFDDRLPLYVYLHEEGTLCFPGRLFDSCHPLGVMRGFSPLGGSLTVGCLHAYHLRLQVVVFTLGSSPVPLLLFLVCKVAPVIAFLRSMVLSVIPYFMEPTRLLSHPCNHGLLIKVVLLVSILCSRACALDDLAIIPTPMLFPAHCTPFISPSHNGTWVRCAQTWPW
jgi:hypothetical protein